MHRTAFSTFENTEIRINNTKKFCIKFSFVGWLFGFYGISTFCKLFNAKSILCKYFCFKQFSLAGVHSLSKTFPFQAIQFIQPVLIQLIQFGISTDFVYTQLNFKTVQY